MGGMCEAEEMHLIIQFIEIWSSRKMKQMRSIFPILDIYNQHIYLFGFMENLAEKL